MLGIWEGLELGGLTEELTLLHDTDLEIGSRINLNLPNIHVIFFKDLFWENILVWPDCRFDRDWIFVIVMELDTGVCWFSPTEINEVWIDCLAGFAHCFLYFNVNIFKDLDNGYKIWFFSLLIVKDLSNWNNFISQIYVGNWFYLILRLSDW